MISRYALFQATTPLIHLWWRVNRGTTLGARVAAVDDQGRVALIRHAYKLGWHLPGGGVERGERAEDSARRELEEEAHAVAEGPLELFGVYANFSSFAGDHVLIYRTRARSLGFRPPDQEIAEVAWVRPEEAPADTTPGTRRRLAELFAGAAPSIDW